MCYIRDNGFIYLHKILLVLTDASIFSKIHKFQPTGNIDTLYKFHENQTSLQALPRKQEKKKTLTDRRTDEKTDGRRKPESVL